ncbi:hypothetical protein V8G54_005741, partial [Vigna mungo]
MGTHIRINLHKKTTFKNFHLWSISGSACIFKQSINETLGLSICTENINLSKLSLIQQHTEKQRPNHIESNQMKMGKGSSKGYPAPDESLRRVTLPPVSAGSNPHNVRVD